MDKHGPPPTKLKAVEVVFVDQMATLARMRPDDGVMSAAEWERAALLKIERVRNEWLATRWALRHILGARLNCQPGAVRFSKDAQGKPHLPDAPNLHFNTSHTRGWSAIAVSEAGPVGVDIEWIDPATKIDLLARRFFHAEERDALAAIADEATRRAAFFAIWTSKEAYLKARGVGLHAGLKTCSMAAILGGNVSGNIDIDAWRVAALDAPPGCAAAVCAGRDTLLPS